MATKLENQFERAAIMVEEKYDRTFENNDDLLEFIIDRLAKVEFAVAAIDSQVWEMRGAIAKVT